MEQCLCDLAAKFYGIVATGSFAKNDASVGMADHRAQVQFAALFLCICPNRHLASSAQRSQQRPLALDGLPCLYVVEKGQQAARLPIIAASFYGQRTLPDRRTHHICRDAPM